MHRNVDPFSLKVICDPHFYISIHPPPVPCPHVKHGQAALPIIRSGVTGVFGEERCCTLCPQVSKLKRDKPPFSHLHLKL